MTLYDDFRNKNSFPKTTFYGNEIKNYKVASFQFKDPFIIDILLLLPFLPD